MAAPNFVGIPRCNICIYILEISRRDDSSPKRKGRWTI